jgi:hypothetical protein
MALHRLDPTFRMQHRKTIKSPQKILNHPLGSGLVDQSQKMTVAAGAMAEKKAVGHRS